MFSNKYSLKIHACTQKLRGHRQTTSNASARACVPCSQEKSAHNWRDRASRLLDRERGSNCKRVNQSWFIYCGCSVVFSIDNTIDGIALITRAHRTQAQTIWRCHRRPNWVIAFGVRQTSHYTISIQKRTHKYTLRMHEEDGTNERNGAQLSYGFERNKLITIL